MPLMGWFDEDYQVDNDCYGIGEEKIMEGQKWWHSSGTWGRRGNGHDLFEVQSASPGGAWIRYLYGHRRWISAREMDAMEEIPPPPASVPETAWWITPGMWGHSARGTVLVELPEAGNGAWVRWYTTQVREWLSAKELDQMKRIPPPPGTAVTDGTDRAVDQVEYDEAVRLVLWLRGRAIERQKMGHYVVAARIALAADQLSRCFILPLASESQSPTS